MADVDNVQNEIPGSGGFEMPNMEQIMDLIKQMNLSPEEEADLMKSLHEGPTSDYNNNFQRTIERTSTDYMLFLGMFILISSVFGKIIYQLLIYVHEFEA